MPIIEAIKLFVRRMMMGKGSGILKIPPKGDVNKFAKELLKKFKEHGVPDSAVNNPKDVRVIWEQITNKEAQVMHTSMDDLLKEMDAPLTSKKSAEVRPFMGAGKLRIQQDVDSIVKNLKSMEPTVAMKEANLIIGRKGNYKHLSGDEAQRILKETDDHIFQRDVPTDEPPEFASGGIAGELRLNRQGYAEGREVIEKTILSGPQKSGLPGVDKIIDAIGGAAGISTLGLPKWLISKLMQGGVRSNLAQKYHQLAKENRLRDARQLLTAQDPYIGEDPEMSEAKRTFRKYSRRVPTEEEEEFRLSPEMIEEGWRYPGRRSRGVPHERTARNKRGYTKGGLAHVLGV